MLYTLCQRLCHSPKIGFEYEYMGAAEYEFGSTRVARQALDSAKKLVKIPGSVKVDTFSVGTKRVECVFIIDADHESEARKMISRLQAGDYRNKMGMWRDGTTVGWLILDPVPALVYFPSNGGEARAQKFLDHGTQLFSKAA